MPRACHRCHLRDLGELPPFPGPPNYLRFLHLLGGGPPNLSDKAAGNLRVSSLQIRLDSLRRQMGIRVLCWYQRSRSS